MPDLHPDNIPQELRNSRRWVLWALCDVTAEGKVRKSCKIPFNALTGNPADHSDPNTWCTFQEALDAHAKSRGLRPSANTVFSSEPKRGIGMVLGPPWFGKDFDKCIVEGKMDPEVEAELASLNSYAEISQSGTGVHVIGHGEPPYPEGHRKDDREIYSRNRYFVVTGKVIGDYTEIRRFTPQEVKAEYDKVKNGRSKQPKPKLNEPTGSYTSAKIADLMTRTDFADLSQGVMSLLTLLAIEHTCDPVKIEAEFKKSKLYTDTHWNEKWDRLKASEIAKAIEHARDNIQKRLARKGDDEPEERTFEHGWLSEVEEKPLLYLWKPVLPQGKLCHFAGRSSEGKSPVTLDLIARITRGDKWPDGQANTLGPKKAILMNIEDGLEDMIAPRFTLAGGVKESLCVVRGVKIKKRENLRKGLVALDKDIAMLCDLARSIPDLGIIVIDPITNYLGKVKMNHEDDVRTILTPLAGLAEELGIVVVTVGHVNKNRENLDPLARIMGAAAFAGVARSVYMFEEDKEKESKYSHIMSPARTKENSYLYHTEEVEREFSGGIKAGVIRVVWDGVSGKTAEEAGEDSKVSRRDISKAAEAALELKTFLRGGKRSAQECTAHLLQLGYDLTKLNSGNVRRHAGVSHKQEGGKSWWFLGTGDQQTFEIPKARQEDAGPSY